ncbi:MAG: hypothetical protein H7Y05_09840 [Steroidobacteraceae bacterium]|nr:hypothetical protein [Deltaproteobacteria bacterium]
MKKIILLAMAGMLVAGCVSDPLRFPKCDMTNAKVLGESEGTAVGIMLFNIIPINQNARFNDAYKEAITKLGGTCLTDPVIEERWFWAYLLNGYIFKVKGTVVKESK